MTGIMGDYTDKASGLAERYWAGKAELAVRLVHGLDGMPSDPAYPDADAAGRYDREHAALDRLIFDLETYSEARIKDFAVGILAPREARRAS